MVSTQSSCQVGQWRGFQQGHRPDFPGNLGAAPWPYKLMGISVKIHDQVADPDLQLSIPLLAKIPFGAKESSELLWRLLGQREGQADAPGSPW